MDVSIIIPIHNGSAWIDNCFQSIFDQKIHNLSVEVCVCNDCSTDNTLQLLSRWESAFQDKISLKIYNSQYGAARGVGFSKNCAVSVSKGKYLCFQDVDDLMMPNRVMEQYSAAEKLSKNYIIGSKFIREPTDSTVRYTKWANNISCEQLGTQIYTSNGPTIIMPTWFMHRSVFENVGGFSEDGKGIPEDLIFFYRHLDLGGSIFRVEETLVVYTYHLNATTHSIHEDTIWNIRIKRFQEKVLKEWHKFTIWNAGKQGRKFYKSLTKENQEKVIAMCDVDKNKIGKFYTPFDEVTRNHLPSIEIIHFTNASPPIVICVKMDMTNGIFEENLKSLQLKEGHDYIYFS